MSKLTFVFFICFPVPCFAFAEQNVIRFKPLFHYDGHGGHGLFQLTSREGGIPSEMIRPPSVAR